MEIKWEFRTPSVQITFSQVLPLSGFLGFSPPLTSTCLCNINCFFSFPTIYWILYFDSATALWGKVEKIKSKALYLSSYNSLVQPYDHMLACYQACIQKISSYVQGWQVPCALLNIHCVILLGKRRFLKKKWVDLNMILLFYSFIYLACPLLLLHTKLRPRTDGS